MWIGETVGVPAHRGGYLVSTPGVTVGVVRAVSRVDGVEVEVIARVPGDRSGPRGPRWPPVYDEGIDPRLGWLDGEGRVRWASPVFGSPTSHYQFPSGLFRAAFALPPLFDEVSLVVAWPQVGFPEAVVVLPLPDRAAVERADTSIWSPGRGVPVVDQWDDRVQDPFIAEPDVESGTVVAAPVVLHSAEHATVVLSRVTAVGALLSLEVLSLARGEVAEAVCAEVFPRPLPDVLPRRVPGRRSAAVAVVHGSGARWPHSPFTSAENDSGGYACNADLLLQSPSDGVLDLLVSWPLAGLAEVRVRVELD